jgi:hypothetical protein
MNFGMNYFRMGAEQDQKPTLIEPGVKSFFSGVLKGCNQVRANHYNTIFNISMFILFFLLLASILYFKYKGKLTPEEKEQKKQQEKQYILTRLNNVSAVINMDKQKVGNITNANLITDLPGW